MFIISQPNDEKKTFIVTNPQQPNDFSRFLPFWLTRWSLLQIEKILKLQDIELFHHISHPLILSATMQSSLPTIDEHKDTPSEMQPMKMIKRSRYSGILSTRTADACLDWVIFPALLFVQFGATMYCQYWQGILILDWSAVIATVAMFCIVAGIYRQVLRRHPMDSLVLLLLPEIFTNILLAMVMLGNIESAFDLLIALTLVQFLVGGIVASHSAFLRRSPAAEDYRPLDDGDDDEDCESEEEWIC